MLCLSLFCYDAAAFVHQIEDNSTKLKEQNAALYHVTNKEDWIDKLHKMRDWIELKTN